MSTTYTIETKDFNSLEITEQSSKFDIDIVDTISGEVFSLSDLTIEQLTKIGIEIIKIASYNASSEELQSIINSHINGGYTAGVNM